VIKILLAISFTRSKLPITWQTSCNESETISIIYLFIIIIYGSAAQRELWPPRPRGFLITHNDAPQSVGLLWTSDQPVVETSTWQHTTNIHAPGGIRTHDRSRRAAVDLRFRPRDRHLPLYTPFKTRGDFRNRLFNKRRVISVTEIQNVQLAQLAK
jgi:hypothetical protein